MSLFQYTVPLIKQARWNQFQQFFIIVQFLPNNPMFVIRPQFTKANKPFEPTSGYQVNDLLEAKGLFARTRRWLDEHKESQYRSMTALTLKLDGDHTQEARDRLCKQVHVSKLYERISWPMSVGVIFPESLHILLYQTKKLWVPGPIKESTLPGLWKRYDYNDRIEYARLK